MLIIIPILILIPFMVLYYLTSTVSDGAKRKALSGKVILITGASSGIGEEIAYQLADLNAKLILVARTESKLSKVKENLNARGYNNVHIIVYDFSNYKESGAVINDALKIYGRLDFVILNHGAMPWGAFLRLPKHQDPDFISNVFNINFDSHVQLILAALPVLENTSGHIFVTSSRMGEVPNVMATIYSATKHALNGFMYSLQQSLLAEKSKVTITVGAIGMIMTKEMSAVLEGVPIPWYVKGDLKECASLIIGSLIRRMPTLRYPRLSTLLDRLMFQLNPRFNEMAVEKAAYEHELNVYEKNQRKKEEMGYQIGF